MVSVAEALRLVLEDLPVVGCERVVLSAARGRVLGEPVLATADIPPFRNSAMDGYAVRSEDLRGASERDPVVLRVVETVPAGAVPVRSVTSGTAIRLMTGSPVPEGADAVVRLEDARDEESAVRVAQPVAPGANIRAPGEDLQRGETVLPAGRVLRPADIGLLASLGMPIVTVRKRPRVAVVATGDELVDVGEPLAPGKIRDANTYTLAAAIAEAGGEPLQLGIVRDRPEAIRAVLRQALEADMVVTSGGVSVGKFDFVREVHRALGVREKFWGVAQKPGKPLSYGVCGRTPVFGLPGNPVSALVCFYLYVLPALRKQAGAERLFLPAAEAVAAEDISKARDLVEFVRCCLEGEPGHYQVRPTGAQSSGVLRSMSLGEALVVGPAGAAVLPAGSRVRILLLQADCASATPPF